MKKKKTATSCDLCCYYVYDEDDECYVCDMNLDEDDMVKFLTGNFNDCPFFKSGDVVTTILYNCILPVVEARVAASNIRDIFSDSIGCSR